MKKYIVLLILLTGWKLYPQTVAPLALGNTWVYADYEDYGISGYDKWQITDTNIIISNKKYYQVTSIWQPDWKRYVRIDTNGVYYMADPGIPGGEYPYYKKNMLLTDTLTYYLGPDYQAYVTVSFQYNSTRFGYPVFVSRLYYDYFSWGHYTYWCDRFGEISILQGEPIALSAVLTGCIIDGVLYGDTTSVLSGVEVVNPVSRKEYRLSQNYPNPFNPETRIDYSVPEHSYVSIKVYTMLGSEVRTLYAGMRPPGKYTAVFQSGNLASGVYLCRMQAGSKVLTRKMILTK